MGRESVWKCVPEVRPSQLGNWCQLSLGWLLGTFHGGFEKSQDVFRLYYANKNSFYHLFGYWGAGKDGWGQAALDDAAHTFLFGKHHQIFLFRFTWDKIINGVYCNKNNLLFANIGR